MEHTHSIDGKVIHTDYDMKPIPERCWDWRAVFDDYDGAPDSHHPVGYGLTEQAAIESLLEQS